MTNYMRLETIQLVAHICSIYFLIGIEGRVTFAEREEILKLHNDVRQQILSCTYPGQPGAKTMPMLQWDDALEVKAQRWVNRCTFRHDSNQDRAVRPYTSVGQNLAFSGSVEESIRLWIDEVEGYNYTTGVCTVASCLHYTQMVWADTTHIGCGISRICSRTWVFCNYGPGGNYRGEKPYESDCAGSGSQKRTLIGWISIVLPLLTVCYLFD